MSPYALLKFYLARESRFVRGPLPQVPPPEETIDCERPFDYEEVRQAAVDILSREVLHEVTAFALHRPHKMSNSLTKRTYLIENQKIEANITLGDQVCLFMPEIDWDPSPVLQAVTTCRNANLMVRQVFIVLDRRQGAKEQIQQAEPDLKVTVFLTREELFRQWLYYMT